jgi:IS30 family transposase
VRPDVEKIHGLRGEGKTDTQIAKELGMKRTTVGEVLRGRHWSQRVSEL